MGHGIQMPWSASKPSSPAYCDLPRSRAWFPTSHTFPRHILYISKFCCVSESADMTTNRKWKRVSRQHKKNTGDKSQSHQITRNQDARRKSEAVLVRANIVRGSPWFVRAQGDPWEPEEKHLPGSGSTTELSHQCQLRNIPATEHARD